MAGYAGSRLLSTETSSVTNYLTADHLGSPRINTDGSGNVTARHDYMPFGEEIATSQRTSGLGYGTDAVRKRFTGYERDGETGLDFAQARTFASFSARFMSADASNKNFDSTDPQSWNRYLYCKNNPLNKSDPTGEWPPSTHDDILRQALDGMWSGERRLWSAVADASRRVDFDRGDPKTFTEANAPQHAMTPASYITAACDQACAGTRAQGEAIDFIATNMNAAKTEYERVKDMPDGDEKFEGIKKSLDYFGTAMHTLMDNRSPAHLGFQVYDSNEGKVPGLIIGGIPGIVVGKAAASIAHWYKESGRPTPTQLNDMLDEIRVAFRRVYGDSAYANSVSEGERSRTEKRTKCGLPTGSLLR